MRFGRSGGGEEECVVVRVGIEEEASLDNVRGYVSESRPDTRIGVTDVGFFILTISRRVACCQTSNVASFPKWAWLHIPHT